LGEPVPVRKTCETEVGGGNGFAGLGEFGEFVDKLFKPQVERLPTRGEAM
jgi:hypothetical protein